MQNAKDSFYIALRNRLALINPSRVVELRAVTRPAILMEEAESPLLEQPEDAYVIRWKSTSVNEAVVPPVAVLTCEISYTTGGSQAKSGLDRGRALSEMDRELLAMLQPPRTPKICYSATPSPVQMNTQVFWSDPVLGAVTTLREQLQRTVEVSVFSLYEQGE